MTKLLPIFLTIMACDRVAQAPPALSTSVDQVIAADLEGTGVDDSATDSSGSDSDSKQKNSDSDSNSSSKKKNRRRRMIRIATTKVLVMERLDVMLSVMLS